MKDQNVGWFQLREWGSVARITGVALCQRAEFKSRMWGGLSCVNLVELRELVSVVK